MRLLPRVVEMECQNQPDSAHNRFGVCWSRPLGHSEAV
ncbi:UNVERIFIED_CONTAM: hypothetical protein GTU68_027770 [Idotea baltica]|nr:hypothetical protein [Idotea baltica]